MVIAREITAGVANVELDLTPNSIYEVKALINDSSNEITISFEGDTSTATNKIVLQAGEKLENLDVGYTQTINYIADSASSNFRIVANAR